MIKRDCFHLVEDIEIDDDRFHIFPIGCDKVGEVNCVDCPHYKAVEQAPMEMGEPEDWIDTEGLPF